MRDNYLEEYFTFLRFPSISTDPAYSEKLGECAHWLVEKLNNIGLETKLVSTPGHPVVWAKNKHQAGRKTVMLYGHYDVQPPDPLDLWDSPPFDPVLKDGHVYARGATDNKGQIFAHILGLQEMMEADGDLPVNLHLIIEGEEEVGSDNLPNFLRENRDALQCGCGRCFRHRDDRARRADSELRPARSDCVRVKITGSKMDLHSGVFGGAVANSVTALARLLATLHDEQGHIAIEGFYDDVNPLEDWERKAWRELPIDADKEILGETGSPDLFGEKDFSTLERLWARPTAEINGIGGGYQGKGTKTVIASHAVAKLTFRLVPSQDGAKILQLVHKHLEKHLPPGVTMEITDGHSGPWYLTDPHSTYGEAAQRALEQAFGKSVALIREGGSIPIVSQFRDILGVETLLLGLAQADCRAHSPNENFPIANLEAGIKMSRAILREVGTGNR